MRKVSREKAFYFFTSIGNYTGESASSVEDFLEKVKEIDSKSLEFHLCRRDFEKWIREVWGYEELAEKISKIEKLNPKREQLRAQIYDTVSNFLEIRKREKQKKPEKAEKTDMKEYLRKLPIPPKEHLYEFKMEKRLKRMLKEQEKKKTKKHEQDGSSEKL